MGDKITVGIDPSINVTGYGVIVNGKDLIDYGTIKTRIRGVVTDHDRLVILRQMVGDTIHKHMRAYELQPKDITVVVEDFQLRDSDQRDRNFDNLKKLLYATGACIAGTPFGSEVIMVKPLQWKGKETKDATKKKLETVFGVKNINHNACDGIMIAYSTMQRNRFDDKLRQAGYKKPKKNNVLQMKLKGVRK